MTEGKFVVGSTTTRCSRNDSQYHKVGKFYSIKVLNVETDTLFTTSHHLLVWLSGIFSTSRYFCFFPCSFSGVATFYEYILIIRPNFSHLSTALYLQGWILRIIKSNFTLIRPMVWIFQEGPNQPVTLQPIHK